jgi:hypothetical protein
MATLRHQLVINEFTDIRTGLPVSNTTPTTHSEVPMKCRNRKRGDDVLPTLALNYLTGEIVPHPDPRVGMTAEMMREFARPSRSGLTANGTGDPNVLPTGYSLDALCANASPALRKPGSSNADVTAEAGAIDAGGWSDSEGAWGRGRSKGRTTSRAGGVAEDEDDHEPTAGRDADSYSDLVSGEPGFDGRGISDLEEGAGAEGNVLPPSTGTFEAVIAERRAEMKRAQVRKGQ